MEAEVLVHIKAPSNLTDDKRYARIAQGTLDFEATTLVPVTGDSVRAVRDHHTHGAKKALPISNECVTGADDGRNKPCTSIEHSFASHVYQVHQESNDTMHETSVVDGVMPESRDDLLCDGPTGAFSTAPRNTLAIVEVLKAGNPVQKRGWSDAFESNNQTAVASKIQSKPIPTSKVFPSSAVLPQHGKVTSFRPQSAHESIACHSSPGQAGNKVPSNPVSSVNTDACDKVLIPPFGKVRALPLVISAPNPSVDQMFLPASKNPVLLATAEALSLPESFKPELLTRKISEWERGYWKLPVSIINSAKAVEHRPEPSSKQRYLNDASWRPLLKQADLTEEEFIEVWNDLNKYVASGKAGNHTRVIQRGLSTARSKDLSNSGINFYLHIYCYGEAIPYVYAMLLVCTRMYALCKPLEWVSTLDDKPVVRMTGHGVRPEGSSRWTMQTTANGKFHVGCNDS